MAGRYRCRWLAVINGDAMKNAGSFFVVVDRVVHGAAVVPQGRVAWSPMPPGVELGLLGMIEQ